MKNLKSILKKRWVWGIGVFVLFTLAFASFFAWKERCSIEAADGDPVEYVFQDDEGTELTSGGKFTMRRAEGTYTLIAGQQPGDSYKWVSTNPNIVSVEGADNLQSATLKVNQMSGNVAINLEITHADGTTDIATMSIEVVFSVYEYLNGVAGVSMKKVYESDLRKSLVMDYNSTVDIGDETSGADTLKLVFGNAKNAEWISSNDDVIKYDPVNHRLQAVGAGPATLTVSYVDGTKTYEDTINVYVRPKLWDSDGNDLAGGTGDPNAVTVENGDKVKISVRDDIHPELAIGDKIVWVISKGEGEFATLVRDSLGNTGKDAEEAKLVYVQSEKAYRVDAKAGIYNIQFYVKGTYTNFEDSKTNPSSIETVNLKTNVRCTFTDKEITLNLGSSYSLADAFNMPLSVLKENFSAEILGDGNTYVALDWDTTIISTKLLGTAQIKVTPNAGLVITDIPGLSTSDPVTVTVIVSDTFSLNISEAKIAVGSTLDLYGIIGSNADSEMSAFRWSVSDGSYASLSNETGRYVTVTAKKETKLNSPVTISLAWTDKESVTWVAYCRLTITSSATDFRITPDETRLEVGKTDYLQTNLTGTQNILWVSSDTSIVTVEPQTGNVAAKITATEKTGDVVITAINKDNDTYATAVVTVTAPITKLSIDKGTAYTTTLATSYIFMNAVYQPTNATSTEMIWESSDPTVATVDDSGMVTVLKLGQTTITVKPTYNPNGVFAQCVLTVKDDPITAIRTDVTTLSMIKGDTYQVTTTLTPENPTDRTLTWSTNKASVATVNNGKITAVGVGTATIMVQGGNATPVLIEVTVRDRITSIAFKETAISLPVKQTKQLEVIFTPDKDVNKNLTFYSSDTSVVTVDAKGLITAVSVGQAMITCISEDLGKYQPITCNITVTKEVIVATDFTIEPSEQTIQVGEEFTITPIFTPEDTLDQRVTYQSLNEEIATVDETGKVVGVMAGETMIQCTAVESRLTALCNVKVEEAVEFSLSPSSREIALGKSFKITKVVEPNNVNKSAIWQTSNSKIASISSTGKVTGKKLGTCTITCTLKKYNQSATCRVKVAKLNSTLKLDKTSIRMNVGSTYRLKKTVWSNNSTTPSVRFSSQNKKIASVGATSGKIKAKKVGSTVITAKTVDEVRATARCRVIVIRRATSVSLNKTYAVCTIGRTIKLKATVKPDNASIKKVAWTSSDPNIASVTASGKITGYAEGDVYITATTTDGSNKSAKCYIKVTESVPASNVMVAQQNLTLKQGNTATLAYTILPSNHTDDVQMASDNKKVAKVNNKGKVTAVGTGTATITITTSSGTVATVEVNVVSLNKSSVRMRQYDTETLMVMGTDDDITWYSANNRIATVTNGKITAKGTGTTYVYAFVNGCKMGCKITVVSVNTTQR